MSQSVSIVLQKIPTQSFQDEIYFSIVLAWILQLRPSEFIVWFTLLEFSRNLSTVEVRGRHPGQGSRDTAVPVLETRERDRDSFQNPRLGPGLKFKFCGFWDWDRDWNVKNPGPGIGTHIRGTRDSGTQLWGTVPETKEFRDSVPGTENCPGHGSGPVPTPGNALKSICQLYKKPII